MSNVRGPDEAQNPSFEELVAQYQGSVLRMCFLYLCDKTLAEDAVQETFVKVYRGLNGFHGQSSIKTWIMKIAIHTCYDMNHSGWFRHFDRRITPEMLPEAAVPFEERDEELITAVMQLPIKLREVILLFYYQGFSIQEIMDTGPGRMCSCAGRCEKIYHRKIWADALDKLGDYKVGYLFQKLEDEEDIETKATQLMWDIMLTTAPEFLSDGYRVQFRRVIEHETGEEKILDVIVEHAHLGSG